MDYRIRYDKSELESTCYMEVGRGKYTGLHWQEGFIFVRDDAFSVAEGIVEKHFPNYDHLAMNDIPRSDAIKIISDWRSIADRLSKIDRSEIEREMNLNSSWFSGLETEVDRHRIEISIFLQSLAAECENFLRESEWICILGM